MEEIQERINVLYLLDHKFTRELFEINEALLADNEFVEHEKLTQRWVITGKARWEVRDEILQLEKRLTEYEESNKGLMEWLEV